MAGLFLLLIFAFIACFWDSFRAVLADFFRADSDTIFSEVKKMYPYQPYGAFQTRQEVTRVNGENGARAYQLPPNSSALLLDNNEPIVWLAQTDGAGYKQISAYKIEPYTPAKPEDLEARIRRLEELIGESNIKPTEQRQTEPNTGIIVA